jgi:hypothetical protein
MQNPTDPVRQEFRHMTEVKTENYLLYALQVLKNMQDDMEILTRHDSKADPEVIANTLEEIIDRCMVPALKQLGIKDPMDAITEVIDQTDILEAEQERIIDELEDDEEYEEEEEEELVSSGRKRR